MLFKNHFSSMIIGRYLPGRHCCQMSPAPFLARVVGDAKSVSNSPARDEVLSACWNAGRICAKFLWQALANLLQHRSQKAGLEVRPGGFFHAQAMMGSLCEEFGQPWKY